MAYGANIVVGDAEGIDEAVIDVANEMQYADITVYGAYGRLKRKAEHGKNIALNCTYPVRDISMAKVCTRCITFWDGTSHGTKITFGAVERLYKPVKHMCERPI